jgi:hypothetical protein
MKLSLLVAALTGLGLWALASAPSPASQLSPVMAVAPAADGLLEPVRRFRGGGRSFRGGSFHSRSFSARSFRGGAAVRHTRVTRTGARGRTVRRSTATRHVARGGTVRRGATTRHVARAGTVRRGATTRRVTRAGNVRRTVVVRRGNWTRPGRYWWRPGSAVAAGAAIGWVSAATAAAWAGSSPGPDMCWYYTDSTRTRGFWDVCP